MPGPNDEMKDGPPEAAPGCEGDDKRASKWMLEDQLSHLKWHLKGLENTPDKTEKEKWV